MKKAIYVSFFSLLLAGCMFNPNNRDVAFFKGIPYYAPVDAQGIILEEDQIADTYKMGIYSCKPGDLFWVSPYEKEELTTALKTKRLDIIQKMADENLIGCVSPMSEAELNYITTMQAARASAAANNYSIFDAMNAWTNGLNANTNAMINMQNQNTINSVNRNLRQMNDSLDALQNQGNRQYYKANPLYPY